MKRAHVYEGVVDGIRRYIGTNHGTQINVHMKKVRSIARRRAVGETIFTTNFYDKLTKAWLEGAEISFNVLFDELSDEEAFAIETKMIAGTPRGQLWNIALDGKDVSPTKAWRVDHSETRKLSWPQNPDYYKKHITGSFGFITARRTARDK